jgi:hypothetical protein
MTNTYNIVGANPEGNRPYRRLIDVFDLFAVYLTALSVSESVQLRVTGL